MRLPWIYRLSAWYVVMVCTFPFARLFSADAPVVNFPAGQAAPPVSQTVMTNSFESVEMEKLRIAKEVGKLSVDDADFNEAVVKLQKKLAEASLLSILPPSVPSELRTFLNAGASEVERSKSYYTQLSSVLNKLSPESPYNSGTARDTVNPKLAADLLHKVSSYEEDEGLSQTILNQWGAKEGGARDDARRISQIDFSLQTLLKERKRLEWNYKMTFNVNTLTGEKGGTDADRDHIMEQINEVKTQMAEFEAEKSTLKGLATIPLRKLEFQQFILQLGVQQRYLHALIACGFYRNVFTGGDMSIKQEARPERKSSPGQGSSGKGSDAAGNGAPVPAQELSTISTITGLESFLLNRIRDAKKDREALENMLASKQISAAESLAGKMVMTAKYQPELHTVPIQDRQKIRDFYQSVRQLSEAVNTKNYPEILKLSGNLSASCSDIGTQDLKAFAEENRKKALFWVGQAEIAGRLGDARSTQLLLEFAQRRAPQDPEVEIAIKNMQASATTSVKLKDELAGIIERQDYATASAKMADFMPLASAAGNESLKKAFLELLEKEKAVRTSLERSESFEKMRAYPEAWLALENVPAPLDKDPRLQDKKNALTSDCADFISAYTKGRKLEVQGQAPLALAWYLEALSLTSGNPDVKIKIKDIGGQVVEFP
jgi:hypothetical protein